MCKTCNGTGGLNIEHSWGLQSFPCPDSNCDFDNEKAIREQEATIHKFKTEIHARQLEVS